MDTKNVTENVVLIDLGDGIFTVIDKADDWVLRHQWRAQPHGLKYRVVTGSETTYFLSRMLMGAIDDEVVDHEDRDPLNNRRSNLRITNRLGNSLNRGLMKNNELGIAGVQWRESVGKYRARITVNGKLVNLGHFDTAIEASMAYTNAKAKRDLAFWGR